MLWPQYAQGPLHLMGKICQKTKQINLNTHEKLKVHFLLRLTELIEKTRLPSEYLKRMVLQNDELLYSAANENYADFTSC